MHASTALLRGLVDYAGLFPPAALDMSSAVRNYANYLHGPYAWVLGRLIVPASRLGEFESARELTREWGEEVNGMPMVRASLVYRLYWTIYNRINGLPS